MACTRVRLCMHVCANHLVGVMRFFRHAECRRREKEQEAVAQVGRKLVGQPFSVLVSYIPLSLFGAC